MRLDQAVCNVLILLVNVPVTLVSKVPHVTLLVDVTLLVQVAQLVMPLQVNVLATQDTLEPPVIPVPLITIEQVGELVQVSFISSIFSGVSLYLQISFTACGCDATGSSSLQCADSTGICTCKAGYKGNKCDATCGCDTTGSSGTACDQSTGQCTCNTGYTGVTCNSCATNYYRKSDGTCASKCTF